MKKTTGTLILFLLQLSNPACTEPPPTVNPPGYNLAKPLVYKMPSALEEISGIAFNQGNAATIYAEQDEEGKLFYFHLGDAAIKHSKFSKRGDFEDVAISNGWVIMLRSDGVLFTFALAGTAAKEIADVKEQAGLLPRGEYESLYADENNHVLYLLCKNCSDDKISQSITGYVLSLAAGGELTVQDHFSIDEKAIAALSGSGNTNLKPSALARNPVTLQWYITSSVHKLLLITDGQWKPLHTYPLNPVIFTQPEGIAFDKTGNLYISNEKGNAALANILQFNYQKK